MEVARGSYIEMMEWIHRNHCYSLDHAIKYEGYSLAALPAKTHKEKAKPEVAV